MEMQGHELAQSVDVGQMALVSLGVQLVTATGSVAAVFERRFLTFQVQFTDEHSRVARHHFTTDGFTSFGRNSFALPLVWQLHEQAHYRSFYHYPPLPINY